MLTNERKLELQKLVEYLYDIRYVIAGDTVRECLNEINRLEALIASGECCKTARSGGKE